MSYGTVGGVTNSLIGSITGTRAEYGQFPIHVDFSPIGATSYTYQLFFHDLKTLVVANAGPDSVVDVGNSGASGPRVNPIWMNGSHVGYWSISIINLQTSTSRAFTRMRAG